MSYTCANCGTAIGALEQPYQWGDSVVCGPCVARLQAVPVAQSSPRRRGNSFTDPAANKKSAKVLFRVFFWIIAGLIILGLISLIESSNRLGH